MPFPASRAVNRSPLFDSPAGWSGGYGLAIGHGPGVVVGPGASSPSIFAQQFSVRPGQQYAVVSRASSFDKPVATAAIQVNWLDKDGKFVSVQQEYFKVTRSERSYQTTAVVPPGAAQGVLYVVPGGNKDTVSYTEMSLVRLKPIRDFADFEFGGVRGQNWLVSVTALLVLAVLYVRFRKSLFVTGARILGTIGTGVARVFPLLALLACGMAFVFMEGNYEQHYDSQVHQGWIESVMRWKKFSLDLGGNPLHNFGIQHVIDPQLSPTFWIGHLVPAGHRVQVQAAFQAMLLFSIMVWVCRTAGARTRDACAISLVASLYYWVPLLSNEAITLNATLGLLWQEGAIATLLAFFCFARIGYAQGPRKSDLSNILLPAAGLLAAILWLYLGYSELVAFFTLATVSLCMGAIAGVQSRTELKSKLWASVAVIAVLLALGIHRYVLDLFLYTPQMYFKTLYDHDFVSLFFHNTSLLMSSGTLGGAKIIVFFVLAALGTFLSLRFGNTFVRRLTFGGLALEAGIHVFSAINAIFKLVPLTFIYVEQMGLTVIALLAGTAVWTIIRAIVASIPKAYDRIAPAGSRVADLVPPALAGRVGRTFAFLPLLGIVAFLFYRLSLQINFYNGWPPRTDSVPAQIESRELALQPGGTFKGKAAMLLGMDNTGPARWGYNFFPVIFFKYRDTLSNDLMNDAEVAGIPVVNEYGHWVSPPMLALLTTAFYRPEDYIDRAAQAPRVYRPNLARLLGVSLVVSDRNLEGETELYRGEAAGHALYMNRVAGSNLGQYSPTKVVVARDARAILDQLQEQAFDGRTTAVAEAPLAEALVPVERASLTLNSGPSIHVDAYSGGTSLLVLPFDYSHCLEAKGEGLVRMVPVDLALTGLLIQGRASVDIAYRYGLIKGTACRKHDLERIKAMRLDEAASGRLFHDSKAVGAH